MNLDDPFVRHAIDAAVKMLLIPFVGLLVFVRLVDLLIGVQMGWQGVARGVAILILLYIFVMRIRYQRYFQ
jgi:hypothetical protein